METDRGESQPGGLPALETFLSGMETNIRPACVLCPPHPLKPSLVEWKLTLHEYPIQAFVPLETFLSGMETSRVWGDGRIASALETFLSGMETCKM